MGLPWTDVPQPSWLILLPALDVSTLDTRCPAPMDAFRTPAAEVGTYGRGRTDNFA
jgi:hypothetical protein